MPRNNTNSVPERIKLLIENSDATNVAKNVDEIITFLKGLERGIEHRFFRNMTILHIAVVFAKAEVVQELLAKGVMVEATAHSFTSLHLAAMYGHAEVVKVLIKQGANKGAKGKDDMTPLHLAVLYGHTEVIKTLTELDANKESNDIQGMTPLHLAAVCGHTEVVKVLIKQGANKEAKNKLNMTPLHLAAWYGRTDVVKILIERGANVNAMNVHGETPLQLALVSKKAGIAKQLMEVGVNISAAEKYLFLNLENQALIVRAVDAGLELTRLDKRGYLMFAVEYVLQRYEFVGPYCTKMFDMCKAWEIKGEDLKEYVSFKILQIGLSKDVRFFKQFVELMDRKFADQADILLEIKRVTQLANSRRAIERKEVVKDFPINVGYIYAKIGNDATIVDHPAIGPAFSRARAKIALAAGAPYAGAGAGAGSVATVSIHCEPTSSSGDCIGAAAVPTSAAASSGTRKRRRPKASAGPSTGNNPRSKKSSRTQKRVRFDVPRESSEGNAPVLPVGIKPPVVESTAVQTSRVVEVQNSGPVLPIEVGMANPAVRAAAETPRNVPTERVVNPSGIAHALTHGNDELSAAAGILAAMPRVERVDSASRRNVNANPPQPSAPSSGRGYGSAIV